MVQSLEDVQEKILILAHAKKRFYQGINGIIRILAKILISLVMYVLILMKMETRYLVVGHHPAQLLAIPSGSKLLEAKSFTSVAKLISTHGGMQSQEEKR